MRKSRADSGSFRKAHRLPFKLISVNLIIFLALFFIISYIWKALSASDYFTIKDVILREANTIDLSYLIGRDIFSVNLSKESAYILESFPDYSAIKIIRVLPNRIFADFIKRRPVALIRLYRYFALDKEGVLFYGTPETKDWELPVIVGLETKIFGPKPGKKYNTREIALSLNIIKEIKRNRALRNQKIKKIDVTDPTNTSIFIPFVVKAPDYSKPQSLAAFENLEVKIGEDNIKNKIIILAFLLNQAKKDLTNIKYIDLRFKEPVIKLKDSDAK